MPPAERPDVANLPWRKSTYSNAGNQCVEVAQSGPTLLIRDSRDPSQRALAFPAFTWRTFLERIQ